MSLWRCVHCTWSLFKICKFEKRFFSFLKRKIEKNFTRLQDFSTIYNILTGHFIRYNLLVSGWTSFCLQNCLNSLWHRFNKVLETFLKILVHIDMIASHSCCRFVGCTSMMWISRSTTSQRCSIGLRSGDYGGHLSKVNSLLCSRNQSEMIWGINNIQVGCGV